jgi:hypothetical protein
MAVIGAGRVARLGDGRTGRAWYYDGTDARTITAVKEMRRGFNNIPEMLSKPGATWAHRGGSLSWAEGSLYSYTQAVAAGYGVLELSMSRTKDGVWFMLHDQYLDRTSGLPAGTNADPTKMTWAELTANYQITVGNAAPQPYARAIDVFSAYAGTHLMVVDPKYQGDYLDEFFAMVTVLVGLDRAIFKFSGGAAWLAAIAKSKGFKTWGFYYEADYVSGEMASTQSAWDFLGMDYTASQAAWNAVKSYGKPVVAHIIPNQAAYNTAIAKGADMVQVSGVAAVTAKSWF